MIAQTAVSVALVAVILLQQRGTAIGSFMGGGSGESYASRRGMEKYLLWATIILLIVFVGLAIANLVFA
ncbi:MAG TPA: preprotein translocase subunit SecG [Candidatus Pacearchaeota archaeon]|nr:preprotein translocase subunit SecG [Candidatus Pacearchaeota archaeon]